MVSILTATWNDGPFLEECIESVLNQDYRDWEWIIVNNGSTDQTFEVLSKLKDERIKVIHLSENVGVSNGRNRALDDAKGEFICFLDGDDILPSQSLSSRIEVFKKDADISFVDGKVITFKEKLANSIAEYIPQFRGVPLDRLLSLDGSVFMGNTWMLRVKQPVPLRFDKGLTHGEELLFYIRSVSDSTLYDFTNQPVLYYRKHGNSAMSNIDGQRDSFIRIITELKMMRRISTLQIATFKKKAASIIFKSFAKQGRIFKAISGAIQILVA